MSSLLMKKTLIKKNNVLFYVNNFYSPSLNWFQNAYKNWENETFDILDYYSDTKNGVYLDIGAWIGPTVLYAAKKYKKVVCFEPDPVALDMLKANLSANSFKNIVLIEKALSNNCGTTKFGSHVRAGSTMSTMLVDIPEYAENGGFVGNDYADTLKGMLPDQSHEFMRIKWTIDVETVTLKKVLNDEHIDPDTITLIKMDIEGGEFIVIPYLQSFLKEYHPVFYISLHRGYLLNSQINDLLDMLFNIYNTCFYYDGTGNREQVSKEAVQTRKLSELVFE